MYRCKPRHALLFLWLGCAALVLHALAGVLHTQAAASDGTLEICTAQGTLRLDARTLQALPAAPLADAGREPQRDSTPCCELCSVSCSTAIGTPSPGYRVDATAAPTLQPVGHHPGHPGAALTPLLARGPPARS